MKSNKLVVPAAHREGLSEQTCRFLDALNADPRIGPHAKGDGCMVEWMQVLMQRVMLDFINAHPELEQAKSELRSSDSEATPNIEHLNIGEKLSLWFAVLGVDILRSEYRLTLSQEDEWGEFFFRVADGEISSQWGGRRIRIRKLRAPPVDATARVGAALRAGLPMSEVIKQSGVSRTTVYRILQTRAS